MLPNDVEVVGKRMGIGEAQLRQPEFPPVQRHARELPLLPVEPRMVTLDPSLAHAVEHHGRPERNYKKEYACPHSHRPRAEVGRACRNETGHKEAEAEPGNALSAGLKARGTRLDTPHIVFDDALALR